jgi:hypothetical protein
VAYVGREEAAKALEKVTGTNFEHTLPTPITKAEFEAKQAANKHLVATAYVKPSQAFNISPIAEYKSQAEKKYPLILVNNDKVNGKGKWKTMPPETSETPEFIIDGIKMNVGGFVPKVHECHPELMDRVSMATNNNVQLHNRTSKFGQGFNYRLYCTRCHTYLPLTREQVNHVENPDDDVVTFCMGHHHDNKPGAALRVLSAFANVSYSEAGASEPKGIRKFREDDDE